MASYEIKEIREHHYVKLVDGKVVSTASYGDFFTFNLLKKGPDIDIGLVETSLGILAVLGFLSSLDLDIGIRIIIMIVFFFQIFATGTIYWYYIRPRLPKTFNNYLRAKENGYKGDVLLFLIYIYPKFFIFMLLYPIFGSVTNKWFRRTIVKPMKEFLENYHEVEFAYLTLLGVVLITSMIVGFYIMITLQKTANPNLFPMN